MNKLATILCISTALLFHPNPQAWSRGIAVEKAYLHGELKGGTDRETAVELPEGYTKAAKVVAEKQAALAGYRLADEIQKWVK
jgi:hypothetical protein